MGRTFGVDIAEGERGAIREGAVDDLGHRRGDCDWRWSRRRSAEDGLPDGLDLAGAGKRQLNGEAAERASVREGRVRGDLIAADLWLAPGGASEELRSGWALEGGDRGAL